MPLKKTEQTQAEKALEERLRFETLLANLSARFINLPPDRIDSEIVDAQRQICECLDIDRSTLWQIPDGESGEMRLTHIYQPQDGHPASNLMNAEDFFPWVVRTIKSGTVISLTKLSDLPPEASHDLESFRLYGTKSNFLMPLSSGEGPVFGLLTFAVMHEERIWPEAVVTGFKLIAYVFVSALERKRVDEELRQHEQERSKLTGKIITAQEDELRRLSREIHDDLTQRLAALALDAALIEKQLLPVQPQAVQDLRDLRAKLADVAEDVHNLSRRLHPSILDDLGLVQAVQAECAAFVKKTGIDLSFTHDGLSDTIPQNLALCLYRVIQEGLQNIAKHSGAAEASIAVQGLSDGIGLFIQDKGSGFDTDKAKQKAGIGLSSMRERVRLVNGTIAIESKPGQGSKIISFIPFGGMHD